MDGLPLERASPRFDSLPRERRECLRTGRIVMDDVKLNVLVVDDDESVRDSLRLMLESSGYSVLGFKSAEDLLDSGFGENPFCLILDIRLPGMSGFKLQEHLLKSQIKIPVIFITGHDRDRMEDEAMRLGAVAYLRKPFEEQRLLEAIGSACEKGMSFR